jgi:hypothetical protein
MYIDAVGLDVGFWFVAVIMIPLTTYDMRIFLTYYFNESIGGKAAWP